MIPFCLMFVFAAVAFAYLIRWLDNYTRSGRVGDLRSKRILVTGTDYGLGRDVAVDLCRRGMTVYAGCHTSDGVRRLQSEPGLGGDKMKPFALDVSSDESVADAKKLICDDLPDGHGLWALVNNAAIVGGVATDWTTVDQFHEVMDVNFYGTVRMTIAFLPLVKLGAGRIVNVGSIMGRFPLAATPYVASKSAMQAYTSGIRRHVASQGVTVSIIEPGSFRSNMSSAETIVKGLDRQWDALTDDRRRELGGQVHREQVKSLLMRYFDKYPLASGNRMEEVIECVAHAVLSERPRARYVCGFDAKYLYRPVCLLPDWAADRIVDYIFQ